MVTVQAQDGKVRSEESEQVSCNLCGCSQTVPLRGLRDRLYGGAARFHLVKCTRCGLIYLNPRPTRESILRYYPDEYAAYSPPADLSARTDFHGFRGWLRGRMFVRDSLLGRVLRAWFVRWKTNWRWFYAADPSRRGQRMLDIGCGAGQTLVLFKRFGWDAHGIDISPRAVEVAAESGLNVVQGGLADRLFPDHYFDLAWMSHVLEHVHNPEETLAEVARLVRPEGIVYLEIPVVDALLPRLFGQYYFAWECPRHLYHFTKRTLFRLAGSSGFKCRILGRASNAWILSMSLSYLLEALLPGKKDSIRRNLSTCEGKPWFPFLSFISTMIRIFGLGEILFVELRNSRFPGGADCPNGTSRHAT